MVDAVTQNKTVRTLVLSIAFAIFVYTVLIFWADKDAFLATSTQVTVGGWCVLLLLSMVNYLLRYLRWNTFLFRASGVKISIIRHLLIYFSGFAFTTTPAKAGEMLRSFYLQQLRVKFEYSLAVLFAERFYDLICIMLLSIIALLYFYDLWWLLIVSGVLVLSIFVVVKSERLQNRFAFKAGSVFERVISTLFASLVAAKQFLRGRNAVEGMLLGIIAWGAEAYGFYYLLQLLSVEMNVLQAVGIYSVAMLAGALSFIPGGLGSMEAVMISLLKLSGVELSVAISATLICRVVTLWFAVGLGAVAFLSIVVSDHGWFSRKNMS